MNDLGNQEVDGAKQHQAEERPEVVFTDLPPTQERHRLLIRLKAWKTRLLAATYRLKCGKGALQETPLPRQRYRSSRGRVSLLMAAFALCAILLLLVSGSLQALLHQLSELVRAPTSPLVSHTSPPAVPILEKSPVSLSPTSKGTIGPLPASCPKANSLQRFASPADPLGVGGGPLWIAGFAGPTAALVHLQQAPPSQAGWYELLTLFVEKGYTGTIILQGINQLTHDPLLFSDPGSMNFGPSFTLALSNSTGRQFSPHGAWETTRVKVLVPAAGCYLLQAYWFSSSWTIYFAAGR